MRTTTIRNTVAISAAAVCLLALPSVAQESGRGAGTDDRQWVAGAEDPPESISPADHLFTTQPGQVPLSDGTTLDAIFYRPVLAGSEEPGPCVLWAEGYSPPSALGPVTGGLGAATFENLATRGYAGAHVFLRGSAPDDEALYHRYAEDGYEIVEWMAAQDWCDGNVGMIGASLDGISQWLTAKTTPPSLKAIVPQIACGECYWYLWYQGGTLPGDGRRGRTPPVTAYDEYAAAAQHRDYDAWWQQRDTDLDDYRAIAEAGIAVMQCGGWDDYIFAGGLRAVEQLTALGGEGMHIVGPCAHGGETPTLMPYDLDTFTVLWFDRFLRGIDNGIDTGPEALIYVQGAEQYRFEPEWPIPDARTGRLFLRAAESGTAESLNDGSLSVALPGQDEAPASYDYSPDGPYNDAGGGGTRPTDDQRPDEENSLTWTSEELQTPTEVTGWPMLRLFASADAEDTDFVAELTDVAPDGTSTTVGRGWLNASRAEDPSNPDPLTPGEVREFALELWPMSYVFQPGHRIRLDLAGSDVPGTDPNPVAATVTVLQDADHPSSLELPIIGTAELPGADGAAGTGGPGTGGQAGEKPGGSSGAPLPATGGGLALAGLLALASVSRRRGSR